MIQFTDDELRRTKQSVEFAMELQKRSRSLSQKDTELYKKLIQSKLEPGFPEF